jgi:hypothetical protein
MVPTLTTFRKGKEEIMKQIVLVVAGVIVFCLGMDWVVMGHQFFLYKFFAPRQAEVERQVYEHTKSYRQGSIQRLGTLCTQVAEAGDGHKSMINGMIKQEFEEWDMDSVPAHLQGCLTTARSR